MKSYGHKRSFSVDRSSNGKHRTKMSARLHSPYAKLSETDPLLGATKQRTTTKTSTSSKGPDGLVSWFVAFANFLINLIVVGLGRMSGLLYVVFMRLYGVDRQTASVPFAVQQAARNLFGPVAGVLGQKYGVRAVTVGGGILGAAATAGCFFVSDLDGVTACWGLLFGICTALTTTLNQVPIDEYFEKHRTTAGGLAFSGGCVGAFLFPPLLQYLIKWYGVQGTFLVMAAIVLNVVPAALVLRSPPWKRGLKSNAAQTSDVTEMGNTTHNDSTANGEEFHSRPTILKLGHETLYQTFDSDQSDTISFPFLLDNSRLVYQLFTHVLLVDISPLLDDQWTDTLPLVQELQDMHHFVTRERPLSEDDSMKQNGSSSTDVLKQMILRRPRVLEDNPRWAFVAAQLRELADADGRRLSAAFPVSQRSRVAQVLEMLKELNNLMNRTRGAQSAEDKPVVISAPKIEADNDESQANLSEDQKRRSNSFGAHIWTAIRLHGQPLFLLVCACRAVFMLTFIPMVTVVVDFAMDRGMHRSTGPYAIAVLSLGDLVGRLCFGWVTDSGLLRLPRYMLLVMLLLGASSATLPLAHTELALLPALLAFGALQGSLFVRHQLLVSHYMEQHEQAVAMGCINFLSGFVGFGLPSYIGYFRDTMGSYDHMLQLNGAICAAVGLLWLLEPLFATSRRRKDIT